MSSLTLETARTSQMDPTENPDKPHLQVDHDALQKLNADMHAPKNWKEAVALHRAEKGPTVVINGQLKELKKNTNLNQQSLYRLLNGTDPDVQMQS